MFYPFLNFLPLFCTVWIRVVCLKTFCMGCSVLGPIWQFSSALFVVLCSLPAATCWLEAIQAIFYPIHDIHFSHIQLAFKEIYICHYADFHGIFYLRKYIINNIQLFYYFLHQVYNMFVYFLVHRTGVSVFIWHLYPFFLIYHLIWYIAHESP